MTITTQPKKKLTFEQFLEQYPEDGRYELVDGEIVRILATRQHEDVADFIADALKAEVNRLNLNYKVSDRIVLATFLADGTEQGRHPDVSVVNRDVWLSNRSAYSALREPIQLAVEVSVPQKQLLKPCLVSNINHAYSGATPCLQRPRASGQSKNTTAWQK